MRSTNGAARHQSKKRLFRANRGYKGANANHLRSAIAANMRAEKQAFIGRKLKKRDFRKLWITRINIASRANGLSYSRFIAGLDKAQIQLDRKQLSELAVNQPEAFTALVEKAKAALG